MSPVDKISILYPFLPNGKNVQLEDITAIWYNLV